MQKPLAEKGLRGGRVFAQMCMHTFNLAKQDMVGRTTLI